MASGTCGQGNTNDGPTVKQTTLNFEEEENVTAAISLLEFCANLEDYTPTVSPDIKKIIEIYSTCRQD